MSHVKTVDIRGKRYVEVAERVRLVHEQQKQFEVVESGPYQVGDRWLWRVVVLVDEKRYIGNAEIKLNAPKGTPDGSNPFECGETSALGRALAFAGFGTVESIASLDEVYRALTGQESEELPPVKRGKAPSEEPAATTQPPAAATGFIPAKRATPLPPTSTKSASATPDQIKAIIGMSNTLGLPYDLDYIRGLGATSISAYMRELAEKCKAAREQKSA